MGGRGGNNVFTSGNGLKGHYIEMRGGAPHGSTEKESGRSPT